MRYDPRTEFFGVIDNKSNIRTFYKAIPCASITAVALRAIMKSKGLCHDFATNLDYYNARCLQW